MLKHGLALDCRHGDEMHGMISAAHKAEHHMSLGRRKDIAMGRRGRHETRIPHVKQCTITIGRQVREYSQKTGEMNKEYKMEIGITRRSLFQPFYTIIYILE